MNMIPLLENCFANAVEAVNIYSLFCVLNHAKITFSRKIVLYLALWSSIIGLSATILGETKIGVYIFKIIFHLSTLTIMYFYYKKNIHEVYVIFAVINVMVIVIQLCAVVSINLLPIPLSESKLLLIAHMLTILITFVICYHFPTKIYEFWFKIKYSILMHIVFYVCNLVLFGILIAIDFNAKKVAPDILLYIVFIAISAYGFYKAAHLIVHYTTTLPRKVHDFNNFMYNIRAIIRNVDYSKEMMLEKVDEQFQKIGLSTNAGDEKDSISNFIQSKMMSTVQIEYHVFYHQENALVSDNTINQILGILIDNAIEASKQRKIFVAVYVNMDCVLIDVKNDYKKIKIDQFDIAYHKGYTTKQSEHGRGYGLYNLAQIVKEYGGSKGISNEYDKNEKIWSIVFQIRFIDCIQKQRNY